MNLPRWRGLQDIFIGMRIMRAFRRWIAITHRSSRRKREKLHDAGVERHCSRAQSEHRGCSADPDESGGRLLQGCRDAQRTGLRRSELKSWLSVCHRDGEEKGAGFLADPDALDAFLEEIFAHSPLKISIKTRIGVENPDEFERLLDIFPSIRFRS